jgi:1-acyl-sn-glycerol-3-phosphate acyltransferase
VTDAPPATPAADVYLERVLDVLRPLALEVGGPRAHRAVTPTASLEREVGLSSLERVELVARLEQSLARELDDRFLSLDTATELARALAQLGDAVPLDLAGQAMPVLPAAAPVPEDAASIPEALWRRAVTEPDRAHVYMHQAEGQVEEVSYGALWTTAAAVAGGLLERGVAPGEPVALMFPTGTDFLRSFLGIQIARAIPVPLYPPVRLDRLEEYLLRQAGILNNAGVRWLVTVREAVPIAHLLRKAVPSLDGVVTPGQLARGVSPARAAPGGSGDPALIQYTSGSTGHPRGVLLTHANLLANIRAIAAGLALTPNDVGASWLPLYHDMGLIGSWLFCLYHGIPLALMSPLAFLARPERWLWAIHQRRATLSAAPNFAYELCVRRISDDAIEGLDLSSWRCALNGAEPVSPDTLDRFTRRFEPYGFRREALMPVYGLAECAVALCFPPVGRGPVVDRVARAPIQLLGRADPAAPHDPSAIRFLSVGTALPEHEVRIVTDRGDPAPERVVGRLLFRGPSAMSGYFRSPEATAVVTRADGWIDSGDLAYHAGGEVYIAGREKDIIIVGGRNYIPQEIEDVAGEVPGIRKGCVAAFGVPLPALGTEALIVVAETHATSAEDTSRLEGETVARIAAHVGIPPDRVVLVPPGSVPKTSSGKLRRGATRDLYLSGRLGRKPRLSVGERVALLRAAMAGAIRPWMPRARRAAYLAYLGVTTGVFLLPLALGIWGLVAVLPRRATFGLSRRGARLVLRTIGCRLSVEGLENLDADGPLIFASNHCSYLDVLPLMALLPVDFVFVAKKEVWSWPFIGTFVRKQRHLAVDRWDAKRSVDDARSASAAVRAGTAVLFFPEGTFMRATGLRPFRLGAFETAAETGRPVVPLALRGTRHVLRDGRWLPRPGPISLWIGEPAWPASKGWEAVLDLRDRTVESIAARCGEPRLDLVAGGPPRPRG